MEQTFFHVLFRDAHSMRRLLSLRINLLRRTGPPPWHSDSRLFGLTVALGSHFHVGNLSAASLWGESAHEHALSHHICPVELIFHCRCNCTVHTSLLLLFARQSAPSRRLVPTASSPCRDTYSNHPCRCGSKAKPAVQKTLSFFSHPLDSSVAGYVRGSVCP